LTLFRKNIDLNNIHDIIEGCRSGRSDAQRMLYKSYYSFAKSICLRYTSNKEEAEEIMNDGFIKVFTKLEKFDSEQSFKPWLRTVMVNTALDYYRKNQKFKNDVGLEDYHHVEFEEDIVSQLAAEEILELIQELTPGFRTVFVLYVVEGYNHREIAEKLGINEGTSKSNLSKARQKLQQLILEKHPDIYYKNVKEG
jgi:RNA polymerase sigma-70 factor, ECF subfamily